jgi:hypothetical protein
VAKKADTPCTGCGALLWSGPGSLPPDERRCRDCRRRGIVAPTPAAAEPSAPAEPSAHLGPRGTRLWDEMDTEREAMSPPERVLLEEACRAADRLDKLDDFLTGRGDVWLRFRAANEDGTVVRVVVDRALSEVRQQADTLRGIVADLTRKTSGQPAPSQSEGSRRDELAKRRADRRREAAGM